MMSENSAKDKAPAKVKRVVTPTDHMTHPAGFFAVWAHYALAHHRGLEVLGSTLDGAYYQKEVGVPARLAAVVVVHPDGTVCRAGGDLASYVDDPDYLDLFDASDFTDACTLMRSAMKYADRTYCDNRLKFAVQSSRIYQWLFCRD